MNIRFCKKVNEIRHQLLLLLLLLLSFNSMRVKEGRAEVLIKTQGANRGGREKEGEEPTLCPPPGSELRPLLGPQSRFGDKPLNFQVACSQNGTTVLKRAEEKEKKGEGTRNPRR